MLRRPWIRRVVPNQISQDQGVYVSPFLSSTQQTIGSFEVLIPGRRLCPRPESDKIPWGVEVVGRVWRIDLSPKRICGVSKVTQEFSTLTFDHRHSVASSALESLPVARPEQL